MRLMLDFEPLCLSTQSVISLSLKTLLKHVGCDVEDLSLVFEPQNSAMDVKSEGGEQVCCEGLWLRFYQL